MDRNVIFLPGASGDPAFWRPLGDRLPDAWSKTYLAWPGLGEQPNVPGIAGFDDLVGLVESQLGPDENDLVAQSMGGAIALRVALRRPKQIRRLVLVATSGGLDVASLGGADWRLAYREAFPRAAAWITEVRPDFSRELATIAQPTLLIWGSCDRISPVAVGERLRETLPNAKLLVVPEGDHGLAQNRVDEIKEPILEHLA